MKPLMCAMCGVWIALVSIGQTTSLSISTNKTTSLIFPYSILHVDRGTKDVLVQPVKEAENILLIKAATRDFPETNLSIVTGDGNIYSFVVRYEGNPSVWVYRLPAQSIASISTYANGILDNPKTMHGAKDSKWNITSKVVGIYIKNEVIYYQLKLENESSIDYGIDFLRFYISDRKKGKRTAVQENELRPLWVAGNCSEVKAYGGSTVVVALEKFTLQDSKYLAIEMNEKNGGRNLVMKLGNKKIMEAISLPDLK